MKRILFFVICVSIISTAVAAPNFQDANSRLIQAAKEGNLSDVQTLLAGGADVNTRRSTDGVTALIWASLKGHTEIVKLLLEKGADANIASDSGLTALDAAKNQGHTETIQLLDKNFVHPGKKDAPVVQPVVEINIPKKQNAVAVKPVYIIDPNLKIEIFSLHKAAYEGNFEEVKALIAKGADVNAKWPKDNNTTPLFFAVSKGNKDFRGIFDKPDFKKINDIKDITKTVDYPRQYEDIVRLLLEKGADINAKIFSEWTYLHNTARWGYLDMTELLINKGAEIDAKNNFGGTPLSVAVLNNHRDIANLLITKGAKVDIYIASAIGDIERVKNFISTEPNIFADAAQKDFSLLHQAAHTGQTEMVKFLIEKGANVNIGYPQKPTPIYWAAAHGRLDTFKLLIDNGAIINSQSPNSPPLLFGAVWGGNKEIVEILINKGADVNVKNNQGWTPLFAAAMSDKSNIDVAELLITKGADVNIKDKNGRTPLSVSVNSNRLDIVKLLVGKGADINVTNDDGGTILNVAARFAYKDIVEFLLANGANVNTCTIKDSWAPLRYAAYGGNKEIVEMLLAKGADINAKDNNGASIAVAAENEGYTELAEFLKKYQKISSGIPNKLLSSSIPNKLFIGAADDAAFLFGQWNGRESFNPPAVPRPNVTFNTFRWTSGDAGIRWPVTSGKSYRLKLVCSVTSYIPEPNIFVNGHKIVTVKGTGWQFLNIIIPADVIGNGDTAMVEIKSNTWTPYEKEPPSPDKRNLGVMVAMFSMTELSANLPTQTNTVEKQ